MSTAGSKRNELSVVTDTDKDQKQLMFSYDSVTQHNVATVANITGGTANA